MTWSEKEALHAASRVTRSGTQVLESMASGEAIIAVGGALSDVCAWMAPHGLVVRSGSHWRITTKGRAVVRLRHLAERLALAEVHR